MPLWCIGGISLILSDKHNRAFNLAAHGRQNHFFFFAPRTKATNLIVLSQSFCPKHLFFFFPAVCALPIDMVLDTIYQFVPPT
jgi:hypothetical protein